jgi:hypothetical protein
VRRRASRRSFRRLARALAQMPLDKIEDVTAAVPYTASDFHEPAAATTGALAFDRPLRAAAYPRVLSLHEQIVEIVHIVSVDRSGTIPHLMAGRCDRRRAVKRGFRRMGECHFSDAGL